jgi:hypothetical protein
MQRNLTEDDLLCLKKCIRKSNITGLWSSYCLAIGLYCTIYSDNNFDIFAGIINLIAAFLHFFAREAFLFRIDQIKNGEDY